MKEYQQISNTRVEMFLENESTSGTSFRQKPESRNFPGLWTNLDPGFRRGDDSKEFGLLFLSPFEGLIFSSLRLRRRYGDFFITYRNINRLFTGIRSDDFVAETLDHLLLDHLDKNLVFNEEDGFLFLGIHGYLPVSKRLFSPLVANTLFPNKFFTGKI
jgi:hypothetical protein